MARFEIQTPEGRFEVEAPDEATALRALSQPQAQQQPQVAPQQPQQPQVAQPEVMPQEPAADAPNKARAEFDALSVWAKPFVAANDVFQLAVNGATLGFGDKAVAGARSLFTGKPYEEELKAARKSTADARDRAGSAGTAAEILGAVGTPTALAAKGVTLAGRAGTAALTGAPGLAARTGLMAAEGTGYGALTAAGNDQDIGTGAAIGALGGAGGNLLGEAVSAGVGKAAGLFNKAPPRLSVDDLKASATDAYKAAEDAGVVFNETGVKKLTKSVVDDLTGHGFDPANEPGVMAALKRIQSMKDGNVTLKGLDTLRKVASNGYIPGNKSNNALIGKIVTRIDELVQEADPTTVMMGSDPKAASEAIKTARNFWGRARKLETVEGLVDRGVLNAGSSGAGGNVENATRQQIKRLLTNEGMKRGFTKAEQEAARKAVVGTPGQNALRLAGKLSPQGNGLMLAMGSGAAVAAPGIAIPAMIAGYGAKKTAEHLSRKSVGDLVNLIAQGGDPAAMAVVENAVQLLAKSKREALSRALTAISVNRTAGREAPAQQQ